MLQPFQASSHLLCFWGAPSMALFLKSQNLSLKHLEKKQLNPLSDFARRGTRRTVISVLQQRKWTGSFRSRRQSAGGIYRLMRNKWNEVKATAEQEGCQPPFRLQHHVRRGEKNDNAHIWVLISLSGPWHVAAHCISSSHHFQTSLQI